MYDSVFEKLNTAALWVIRLLGVGIFLFLNWYAFRYTQYLTGGDDEIINTFRDSMSTNIVTVLGFFLLVILAGFLEKRLDERELRWIRWGMLLFSTCAVFAFGCFWINDASHVPEGDQAWVYGSAIYFSEGEYSFLSPGHYMDKCPQQLGLVLLVEIFFQVIGSTSYHAIQWVNVFLAAGIVPIGYRIIRCITNRSSICILYCVLMMGCVPLVLYTSFVYGDLPSAFCILLATAFLLHYEKSGRWQLLISMVVSCVFALLVRENSLIFLIALGLTGGLQALRKKNMRLLCGVLCAVILPFLAIQGVYKIYEVRSGYEHTGGIPAESYIAMGLQDTRGRHGRYSLYCSEVYNECGDDRILAAEVSKQDIKERLTEFSQTPREAIAFFREKLLTQWNHPLCESVSFNTRYTDGNYPETGSFSDKVTNVYFPRILYFCDRLQTILYFGMLLFFLCAGSKKRSLSEQVLAVTIIGAFLFSVIWEVKGRYAFPYYLMMYPMAVYGYHLAILTMQNIIHRKGRRKEEQGKVVPFERSA